MSRINYSISMDMGALMEISNGINAQLFPLVNQAVNGIAQATASRWIESVQRAKLWSGEKDAYAKTITYRMTGAFSAVVESDYRYAADIENGRPARDLKQMLNTSMKVRTTSKGTRYLIIPFRHNADTVPPAAKALSMSTIVGHTRRLSGTGAYSIKTQAPATVRQRKYNWGDRLAGSQFTKNQQGMVRMNTATRPGVKSSSYLTFRVMSEKSKGWIIPAQPGQHIAQGVQQDMQPVAEAFLAEAIKRTID